MGNLVCGYLKIYYTELIDKLQYLVGHVFIKFLEKISIFVPLIKDLSVYIWIYCLIKLNYDEINIIIDAFNYFLKNKIITIDKKDMIVVFTIKQKIWLFNND